MVQEQGIAKIDMYYIMKAVMMGNSLYSKDWEHGVVYLTNINLWLAQGKGWATIPLKNVSMVGRQVSASVTQTAKKMVGTGHVLIIDYSAPSTVAQGATAPAVAILAGPEAVINTLKSYLQPMCGCAPKTTQAVSEIDRKVLYMFHSGVVDLNKMVFLIGADIDTLKNSMETLKDNGLCDGGGVLTSKGLNEIKKMM
ncbi:MAG: hypothetical protein KAH86_00025 [Methanosarcinales archaeon]|nr:hypothetical protein [Methanosarcinales archaeon]